MKFVSKLMTGISLLALPTTVVAQQTESGDAVTTSVGRIEVQGAGESLGSGYMVQEDAPKARSTVTRAGLQNSIATSNPFQAISLLPGVMQGQSDATGLTGGTLTIRGMRADQIGFTVNGAPVNDSGNFAVFPQEYVDQENLEQIFVTQGSTDTEAPHVGATGGNIGIVSQRPADKFGVRAQYTFGDLELSRKFFRVDTGYIGDFKAFASVSQTDADKWRGLGGNDRFHSDGQLYYRLGDTGSASFNWVYNKAVNNFYQQYGATGTGAARLTAIQRIKNGGDNYVDYQTTNPGASDFYALQVNPFENAIVTGNINFQLTPDINIDISPYMWYGSGGGGFGRTENEAANSFASGLPAVTAGYPATNYGYRFGNLNGAASPSGNPADVDTTDTGVLLYRSSVTRTYRPGINLRATYDFANYNLAVGGWYERARHRQTQPYSYVDVGGNACDFWLNDINNTSPCVVRDSLGRTIQGRDQNTISEGKSIWTSLTGTFMEERLKLTGGLAYRELSRDGTANLPLPVLDPNSPFFIAEAKNPQATYEELLPSLAVSYQTENNLQFFADAAKNFRAPSNFVFFNYNTGSVTLAAPTVIGSRTYAAGTYAPGTIWVIGNNVESETAWTYEAGLRKQTDAATFSVTAFFNDLENYQASAQIEAGQRTTINIGGVKIYGIEAEIGTKPWHGFTLYGSATLQSSEVEENIPVSTVGGVINNLRTAGTELVDTPNILLGASIGYAKNSFFANVNPKCTGDRYATLVNDEKAPAYCVIDATVGFKFGDNAVFRIFGVNLLDQQYVSEIATNATSTTPSFNSFATTTVQGNAVAAGGISAVPGASRFIGASLAFQF